MNSPVHYTTGYSFLIKNDSRLIITMWGYMYAYFYYW